MAPLLDSHRQYSIKVQIQIPTRAKVTKVYKWGKLKPIVRSRALTGTEYMLLLKHSNPTDIKTWYSPKEWCVYMWLRGVCRKKVVHWYVKMYLKMKNSLTERSVEKDLGDSFTAICKTGGVTKKGRRWH